MQATRRPARPISEFRLFCLAFVFTFAGIMTNLATFHWFEVYLDRNGEVNRPSDGHDTGRVRFA